MAADDLVGRRSRVAAPRHRFVDRVAALPFADLFGARAGSDGLLRARFPNAEADRPA